MKIDITKLTEYGNLEFLARQLVEGFITGLHKSPYHGFSVEFAEHRLYNTGESTRHIDWKVFAKTDRLYSKQYEEETNLRCILVLDNSSSMHYPVENKGKLRFSLLAASSIAFLLQKQRDAVGLVTFSDKIEDFTPVRSTRSHLNTLFQVFNKLFSQTEHSKPTAVANVLHEIAERSHKRSLVVIFSDMFDAQENIDNLFLALQHLKHKNHEVLLFHVKDSKTEYEFDFEEKPYEFIDLETGNKVKLKPSEVQQQYLENIKKFYADLVLKCAQYKIDFIEVDIRDEIDEILRAYLLKRAKMR